MASLINLAIGETDKWRSLFAVGLIGLVGLVFIRRNIPESPRWLILKNRKVEAQNIVSGIEHSALNNHCFYTKVSESQSVHGSANPMEGQLTNKEEK